MTGASPPAASAIEVGPPDLHHPALHALVWRAGALGEGSPAPLQGDHTLNPELAPAGGSTAGARHAAVLLALAADPSGELAIILTERAAHLSQHAGQIALPGGKIEAGESPTEAALREAYEEVALPRRAVLTLGELDPYLTRTGFLVTPVVGVLCEGATLTPDPNEVAAAFTTPWGYVMDPQNHRTVRVNRDGRERSYYEVMYGKRRIWGVTAGILRLVHERLVQP